MNFFKGLAKFEEEAKAAMHGLQALAQEHNSGDFKPPDVNDREAYATKAAQAVAGDIRMFSGCKDEQTSADVSNVASFGLPPDTGPGGAGGACTNSMILSLTREPECSWVQLLKNMRGVLSQKGYSQIPQLSSSREIALQGPFELMNKNGNGRTKALYIGINYVGQQGELRGCHNDVIIMKEFVESQGFDPDSCRVLMDDGDHDEPNGRNIMEGFDWLVSGAREGDSLFVHYSGHGGSCPDDNGDEEDGMDETLVPVDYQQEGQIRDDYIYQRLVAPVPKGVTMTVVMDCCHSGSILDLPYNFEASDTNMSQAESGHIAYSAPNGDFDWAKALKVAMEIFNMWKSGASPKDLAQFAKKRAKEFFH